MQRLAIWILAILPAAQSFAQSATDIIGSPISVARLERLLEVYVQPTADEAERIDSLHEAYLARVHDEIDPLVKDAARAIAPTAAAGPLDGRAKWLRETNRLQARVADVDAAFLAAAAAAVAEERRGGFTRIRDSRARQRQLAGAVAIVSSQFGERPAFVDLADLLARPAVLRAVAEDKRDALDTALRQLEARTLVQARRYNEVIAKAIEAAEDEPSFDEAREVLRAQFEVNQSACRALDGVLPPDMLLALRTAAARGAIGEARWRFAASRSATDFDLGWLGEQIARDPQVGQEAKAAVAKLIVQWRAEHLEGVEMFTTLALDAEPVGDMNSSHPMFRRVASINTVMRDAEQRALRAIAGALGDRAPAHVIVADGNGDFVGVELMDEQAAETVEPASLGPVIGFSGWAGGVPVMRSRELLRVLEPFALPPDAMANAEAVIEAWISKVYDAKVRTIGKEIGDIRLRSNRYGADARAQFDADAARLRDLQRTLVRELFAADELLYADLAPALGVEPEAAEILALRAERILLLQPSNFVAEAKVLTTPSRVARGANADPSVARALLSKSGDEWRAFLAELPKLAGEELQRVEAMHALQFDQRLGDADARRRASTGWIDMAGDSARSGSVLITRVSSTLDRAIAAASDDAGVRAKLARVRRAQMHPGFYDPGDCATAQLDGAIACKELDDAQRTRLEAIRAEYETRFDALTERMIVVSLRTDLPALAISDEVTRLRGIRGECTDIALRKARRVLGDQLASTVRGLLPPVVAGPDPFRAAVVAD